MNKTRRGVKGHGRFEFPFQGGERLTLQRWRSLDRTVAIRSCAADTGRAWGRRQMRHRSNEGRGMPFAQTESDLLETAGPVAKSEGCSGDQKSSFGQSRCQPWHPMPTHRRQGEVHEFSDASQSTVTDFHTSGRAGNHSQSNFSAVSREGWVGWSSLSITNSAGFSVAWSRKVCRTMNKPSRGSAASFSQFFSLTRRGGREGE